ncbi:hypothetical protein OVA21_13725 [Dietzia sp. SL131]|uniref:hypothetical protein n=1 Tax=Dietzia sp. SL131 TaxID=2995149 RepID=UPI00227D182C|nr:hypothetical protein [Dietzia sp. SL131]MCY1658244.1 hypothetical protein [Dietzia sp. SL131]
MDQARALLQSFCGGGLSDAGGPISGIRIAGSSSNYEQSLELEPDVFYEVCLVAPSSGLQPGWTDDGPQAMISLPLQVSEKPTVLETRIQDSSGTVSNALHVRTTPGAPSLSLWPSTALILDGERQTVSTEYPAALSDDGDFRSVTIGCNPDGTEPDRQPVCVTAAFFRVSAQPDATYIASLKGSVDDPSADRRPSGGHSVVVLNREDTAEDGSASVVVDFEASNRSEIAVTRPHFQLVLTGPGLSLRPDEWSLGLNPWRRPTGVPASDTTFVSSGYLAPSSQVLLAANIHLDTSAITALCEDAIVAIEIRAFADNFPDSSDRIPIIAGPDLCSAS